MRRVVFDIETVPFSEEFRNANTGRTKTRHAPKMRLACVFDEKRNEYRYFTSRNVKSFIKLLQSADEVVSFNGKGFDCHVCRRHCGMKGHLPHKGKHIDIHQIMTSIAGFRVSLDSAVRHNFGERKHTSGRKMFELDDEQIRSACRSDVCHTYRLWQRHSEGTLMSPPPKREREDRDCGGLINFPRECSYCLSVGSLKASEWETEDMSEGQLADYLAGICGTAYCTVCENYIEYGY